MLWFVMVFNTAAFGAPEPGTWNEVTLGLIEDFDGIALTLDPGPPFGGNVGDVTMGRDNSSSSSPGYGHYWYLNGLVRDTLEEGDFVNNGDGTGTSTLHTTRSGGTFSIRGDNLWGHDAGTIYTATVQNESSGVNYYIYNSTSGQWEWDAYEGITHMWGYFDDYPYLIDFTDQASIIDPHYWTDPYGWVILAELTNVNIEIEPISSFSQEVFFEHRLRYGLEYFGVGTWFGFKDHLGTNYHATISGGPLTDELTLNAPYEFLTGYNEFWYKWPKENSSSLTDFSNKNYSFRLYDSTNTQIPLANGDEDGTVHLTSGINMQWLPFVDLIAVTTSGGYTTLEWDDISDYGPIRLYRVDIVNPDPAGPWALETENSWDDDPDNIDHHSVTFYTQELFERYPEITFRIDARQFEYPGGVRRLVNRSSLYYTESAPNSDEDFDGDGIPNGLDPDILPDYVNNLPPNATKDSRGVIQALSSICEDIEQIILDEDYNEAIRKLENLKKRFDGCDDELDIPDKNDWITDCEAQLELKQWVDMLIENLTNNL
jgi:hypothetical protein